ncbi:hypothetical protein [Gynuella sunshinyii]|uniref:hypothetical protein n=1 Tax=Gynuella sunshinyii TaxID=1445505 RepID=UPI0005CC77AE|nr:hypothetical protein [Gynuella sunshinyii]
MLKKVIIGCILALPLIAMAEEKEQEFEISCQGGPEGMVTEVPGIVSALASVKCTVYGQIITGAEGVLWNYPGGFAPVIIPAQMVRSQPEKVKNEYYFTSITAKNLSKNEAIEVYKGFGQGFDQMPKDAPETTEIVATNQKGVVQKVYLFQLGPQTIWGYTCQPACKPEMSFMVMKFERPKS